jgi:deoxycytidylate deaminase
MPDTLPPGAVIACAIATATFSPCDKSKRGVVIYRSSDHVLVAAAFNSPPVPFVCTGSEACRAACSKVAVHAEQRAIIEAGHACRGAYVVHAKVVGDDLVPSGGPSCWQCSRLMLDAGIAGVWLYQESGWRLYNAVDFHALTLLACGLPVSRG